MILTEMKRVLVEGDIQLTKSLGQNFLHDGNQLRRIVDAGEVCATDSVLEIGPGLGPLTELLLADAGKVLAIEMDRRLVEVLEKRFADSNRLQLIADDALKFIRQNPRDWSEWKLVANLPYSVASPILVELAQCAAPPKRMTVTLQLEVAQRVISGAGDDDYGLLALLVQRVFEPAGSFKIPAACFFPPPDVDSACVTLVRRETPLLSAADAPIFERIVRRGFSQRRKMMMKLLKQDWPTERLAAAFTALELSVQVRAERVSLAQFVELTKLLAPR